VGKLPFGQGKRKCFKEGEFVGSRTHIGLRFYAGPEHRNPGFAAGPSVPKRMPVNHGQAVESQKKRFGHRTGSGLPYGPEDACRARSASCSARRRAWGFPEEILPFFALPQIGLRCWRSGRPHALVVARHLDHFMHDRFPPSPGSLAKGRAEISRQDHVAPKASQYGIERGPSAVQTGGRMDSST